MDNITYKGYTISYYSSQEKWQVTAPEGRPDIKKKFATARRARKAIDKVMAVVPDKLTPVIALNVDGWNKKTVKKVTVMKYVEQKSRRSLERYFELKKTDPKSFYAPKEYVRNHYGLTEHVDLVPSSKEKEIKALVLKYNKAQALEEKYERESSSLEREIKRMNYSVKALQKELGYKGLELEA